MACHGRPIESQGNDMNAITSTAALNNMQGMARALRRVIEETDQLLKAAARDSARVDAASDTFAGHPQRMPSRLDERDHTAATRTKHAAREADRAPRAHPYSVIGIAAGAGLLLGSLAPGY